MRSHLRFAIVVGVSFAALLGSIAIAQDSPPASAGRVLPGMFLGGFPFGAELSAVGSDGIYYRVRHDFGERSLSAGVAVIPPPPSSVVEAINLDPNAKKPLDSIAFRGIASQIGIGKDNRLYLVVNVSLPIRIAQQDTSSLVPVPAPQSRLYIIPTPFPPRILGATLESVAVPESGSDALAEGSQNLNTIVQVDFEGHVQSLKVKAVGDQEYVYLSAVIPSYRFPTLTGTDQGVLRLGPIQPVLKLLIFNNNGRKIKEVAPE
ncbi:MAG: hypothetical protein FJW26_20445 [Acidimicrobiia bacterium]|nr:hypothetical protein [Acidimicrobiia bacterium]